MNNLDLSVLAEQLCRIEHKLDSIVTFLAEHYPDFVLRPIGDPDHIDPLTLESVRYVMDYLRNHVARQSPGGTGLLPSGNLGIYNNPLGENNGSPGSDGTPPR